MSSYPTKEKLTKEQLEFFEKKYNKLKKDKNKAFILISLFGSLGIHSFYLGETKRGLLLLSLFLFGWIPLFIGWIFSAYLVFKEFSILEHKVVVKNKEIEDALISKIYHEKI